MLLWGIGNELNLDAKNPEGLGLPSTKFPR